MMAHVIVVAPSADLGVQQRLLRSGHQVTLVTSVGDALSAGQASPPLLLTEIDDLEAAARLGSLARSHGVPWVAWNRADSTEITLAAYAAGACAVLPPDFSMDAFEGIVHTVGAAHPVTNAPARPLLGAHQRGERIALPAESVLWVRHGVIALTTVHEDGTESLTGLCGPGQIVTGSADPAGQPVAHTAAVVCIQPWSQAARQPHFCERLRERLRDAEQWAYSRAHQHVDARLLAVLSLLARKFGAEHPVGVLIDLHLTHALLAAATGSTRATVTRRLAALARRAALTTTATQAGTRFVLTEQVPVQSAVWRSAG